MFATKESAPKLQRRPYNPHFQEERRLRDCNNYHGISLLSIARKIMAKVVQKRLSKLAEGVLTESQCGFRQERSTIDMIFSIRQIQEKAIEQYQELYIVFVDFRKAFDTVDRNMLWQCGRFSSYLAALMISSKSFGNSMLQPEEESR